MSEALERVALVLADYFYGSTDITSGGVIEAARLVLDELALCPDCDGTKEVAVPTLGPDHTDPYPCPTCKARGWSPVVLGEGGKILEKMLWDFHPDDPKRLVINAWLPE